MVGYMSVEEQVDADFSRARRRAFLRRISARLQKGPIPNRLLCFEEVRRKLGVAGGVRRGRRTVRLTDIVGSVSRCSEFDGTFLPLREGARTKWERIDRAFVRGEELPPVSLYKIGSSYFMEDGNHRVSVYRYQGGRVHRCRSDGVPRLVARGPERRRPPDPSPELWRRGCKRGQQIWARSLPW
jgi:hypothetical protein